MGGRAKTYAITLKESVNRRAIAGQRAVYIHFSWQSVSLNGHGTWLCLNNIPLMPEKWLEAPMFPTQAWTYENTKYVDMRHTESLTPSPTVGMNRSNKRLRCCYTYMKALKWSHAFITSPSISSSPPAAAPASSPSPSPAPSAD